MYRYHVLEEKSLKNPGLPAYLSEEIFEDIKQVYNEGTNICTMTSKQWYRVLLDKTVLKEKTDSGEFILKKCRAELKHPDNDWDTSWVLARLKGLESSQISFLWKMLHNLLPTQSRISRILNLSDSSGHLMTFLIGFCVVTLPTCVKLYWSLLTGFVWMLHQGKSFYYPWILKGPNNFQLYGLYHLLSCMCGNEECPRRQYQYLKPEQN